jgi:putative tryptophan/tyrosine transport system substrate-binding protein
MTGEPMRRRDVLGLLGGVAAVSSSSWPLDASAQQDGRMRRVGVLMDAAEDDPEYRARLAAFRQGLEKFGWVEGRNVRTDTRHGAGRPDEFSVLAKELVALQPDVIFVTGTGAVAAAQRESRAIPIVFIGVADPIGSGFIASLARPGGNLTGFLSLEASVAGKWLAMLKEIAPNLARAAFVGNPKTGAHDYFLRAAEALAPPLAIELMPSRVETAADIEHAIESIARVPNGGLVLPPDGTTIVHRNLILALAARHRLPAVYALRFFVAAGGLMSYGTDLVDQYRRAATYVDRILRGDKPADLPEQAPVKYETVLNLKTAKALGLTVPDLMLVRADEVIE